MAAISGRYAVRLLHLPRRHWTRHLGFSTTTSQQRFLPTSDSLTTNPRQPSNGPQLTLKACSLEPRARATCPHLRQIRGSSQLRNLATNPDHNSHPRIETLPWIKLPARKIAMRHYRSARRHLAATSAVEEQVYCPNSPFFAARPTTGLDSMPTKTYNGCGIR